MSNVDPLDELEEVCDEIQPSLEDEIAARARFRKAWNALVAWKKERAWDKGYKEFVRKKLLETADSLIKDADRADKDDGLNGSRTLRDAAAKLREAAEWPKVEDETPQ